MPALPLSKQSLRTTDSPITYFIQKAIETPGLISLAAGLVDESTFPTVEIAAAVAAIMADSAAAKAALQYGSTQGFPALRQQLVERVCHADGVAPSQLNLSANNVLLTTGSQQLLYLLGEAVFDDGDIVIAEAPSYFVYHSALASHGVHVEDVPMDEGGMNLDALEETLRAIQTRGDLHRLKLIYTVDYFQNPTGLSLAADRRAKLVELAKKYSTHHRILILEDAAYRELRYDGNDLPSIKSFDTTNEYVVYTSTFSKPCSPGLKTGYSLIPHDLMAPLCNLKGNHDFGSSNLAQHILQRLIATGDYDRHIGRLREVYRRKRDALLAALDEHFANSGCRWTRPAGGLYVWLSFPPGFDAGPRGPLVQAALDAGVLYVPGEFGHVGDDKLRHEARLSFGVSEPEALAEGVRRLRAAYDNVA